MKTFLSIPFTSLSGGCIFSRHLESWPSLLSARVVKGVTCCYAPRLAWLDTDSNCLPALPIMLLVTRYCSDGPGHTLTIYHVMPKNCQVEGWIVGKMFSNMKLVCLLYSNFEVFPTTHTYNECSKYNTHIHNSFIPGAVYLT